jgi:predicted GH43/DUF377 family glycosyl hydrolase
MLYALCQKNIAMKTLTILLFSFFVFHFSYVQGQVAWIKYEGNPVIKGSSQYWFDEAFYPVVIQDGDTYKMWFMGWNWDDNFRQVGYATSPDRITWDIHDQPVLTGVQVPWTDHLVPGSIIRANDTLRMWFFTPNGSWTAFDIGYAWSLDGISWNPYPEQILDLGDPGSWDDSSVSNPSVYYEGGTYHMLYEGSDGSATGTGYANSIDGISWEKDTQNNPLSVTGTITSVVEDGGTIHAWYHEFVDGYYQLGYAWSTDHITWNDDGEPVLLKGASGDWDDGGVDSPSVLIDGGQYSMWYAGESSSGMDFAIGYAGYCNPCLPEGIEFTTQAQIDNFQTNYPGCTEIEGDVTIYGGEIYNLNGLSSIQSVGGTLQIGTNDSGCVSLTSLSGLENLEFIGENLGIGLNNRLKNLEGLSELSIIEGKLILSQNDSLQNLVGLEKLSTVSDISIFSSDQLSSLNGLEGISTIPGHLSITGADTLNDLSALNNLTSIGGSLSFGWLWIGNASLEDLKGLEKLTYIGEDLSIQRNPALKSLTGLEGLKYIGEELHIGNCYANAKDLVQGNDRLQDFTGLDNLETIGGNIRCWCNDSLTSFHGLQNLDSVDGIHVSDPIESFHQLISLAHIGEGGLQINHTNIKNFNGLGNVTSFSGVLYISENDSLTSLSGLDGLDAGTISNIYIDNNPLLSYCNVQSVCDFLSAPGGEVSIYDNAPGCNSNEEVLETCTESPTIGSTWWKNWERMETPVMYSGTVDDWFYQVSGPCVLYEEDKFKMWFSAYNSGMMGYTEKQQIGYAESFDGINWVMDSVPVIPIGSSGDWNKNKILGSVLRVDDTLRLYYSVFFEGKVGYAWSADDTTWHLYPDPVLQAGDPGSWDQYGVGFPAVYHDGSMYHMYYAAEDISFYHWKYQGGHAMSEDGIHWTRDTNNPVIPLGPDGSFYDWRLFPGNIVNQNDTLIMMFMGFDGTTFADPDDYYSYGRMGCAWSTDYSNWNIVEDTAFDVGPPGSYDEYMVFAPDIIQYDDDHWFMWYTMYNGDPYQVGFACSGPDCFSGVEEHNRIDERISVYPNPTSGVTSFVFRVPSSGNVTLKIYDLHGREVTTMVDRVMPVGEHTVSFDAGHLPPGIYLFRGSYILDHVSSIGKLVIVK